MNGGQLSLPVIHIQMVIVVLGVMATLGITLNIKHGKGFAEGNYLEL